MTSYQVDVEFDKAHRIGPVFDNKKQAVILRLKSHGICRDLYANRKNGNKSTRIRPSLTKHRSATLKSPKDLIANNPNYPLAFAFSDILGNLKVKTKERLNGRFIHDFYDLDDLQHIILDTTMVFTQPDANNSTDPGDRPSTPTTIE